MTTGANQRVRGVGRLGARAAARLAWSVCAATLLLFALSLALIALGWSTPLPPGWSTWGEQVVLVAELLGAPVLGGLIASRRPENAYGWVWLGFGFGLALSFLAEPYTAYALVVEPGSLPVPRTAATVLGLGWVGAVVALPFVFLSFPDGRPPGRRWTFLAWAVAGVGVSLFLLYPLRSEYAGQPANPFEAGGPFGGAVMLVTDVGAYGIFAAIVLSVYSLVFRYRHASGVQRQQIKWFALAAILFCVPLLLGTLPLNPLPSAWHLLLEGVSFAFLYAAIAVAILRHRLYDVDVVINRALVYGPLTATLALVYFGGIVLLQRVFVVLTGQESTLAIVASTLLIAALFGPLRRRAQGFVDRRFYRRKYDAAETLAAFKARLRDETDLRALSEDLVGVTMGTVQPEHVSLWLRSDTAASKPDQLSH